MQYDPLKVRGTVAVEGKLEMVVFMDSLRKLSKMVGFATDKINGLADVTLGVGGVEDAVDTDHGNLVYFILSSTPSTVVHAGSSGQCRFRIVHASTPL